MNEAQKRIQDITSNCVLCEGVRSDGDMLRGLSSTEADKRDQYHKAHVVPFIRYWNENNPDFPWELNPLVWNIHFAVVMKINRISDMGYLK